VLAAQGEVLGVGLCPGEDPQPLPASQPASSVSFALPKALTIGLEVGAMAMPVPPDKITAWKAWVADLNGPRKAEFEASNARHNLTGHRAWLQTNPDGSHVVIAVHDGPGADTYVTSLMQSDDPFDQWMVSSLANAHGLDLSGPMPPAPEQFL
jgi:hypothetical protein